MNNFFRALIAGYGAKKLGGGCFGTILVFVLIWVALGQCSFSSREIPPPQTYPAKHRVYVPNYPANVPGSTSLITCSPEEVQVHPLIGCLDGILPKAA